MHKQECGCEGDEEMERRQIYWRHDGFGWGEGLLKDAVTISSLVWQ